MQPSKAEQSVGYLVKRVQQGLRRRCDTGVEPDRSLDGPVRDVAGACWTP